MSEIKRIEIDEVWADSTVIEAGHFVFIGYCMKNEGQDIKAQIMGAFEVLEQRLEMVGLTLESVCEKVDCLFKNIDDLNYLPEIIQTNFTGSIQQEKAEKPNLLGWN